MERELDKLAQSRIEHTDPHLSTPYTLMELPKRAKLLQLMELPNVTKSNTLILLPRRAKPKTLHVLPSRAQLLNEREL
jgi:hypothetical protein